MALASCVELRALICHVRSYLYRGLHPHWIWFRLVTLVTSFLLALQASHPSERDVKSSPSHPSSLALQMVLPQAVNLRVFLSALVFLANGGLVG